MQTRLPHPLPNETEEYRVARNALLDAEADLRTAVEAVAEKRRALPPGGAVPQDYAFTEWHDDGPRTTRLSDLFAPGKESLILYSYMYGPQNETPCPACTSLLDGWNGIAPHVRARVNLAIVAGSPVERLRDIARQRHWTGFRLLSAQGTSYNTDYMGENLKGDPVPMCTVFQRTGDGIRHFWSSELLFAEASGHPRHMDQTWPLWTMLDLVPEGRGSDWGPRLSYD